MRALSNDATGALLRAMSVTFVTFGGFVVEEISSRPWASATFVGARHELTFRLDGEDAGAAADRFLGDLDATEFKLRGHILADIALISEERFDDGRVRISVEALTVEDL